MVLGQWLARALGAGRVDIVRAKKLGGGAIQENRLIEVVVEGGPEPGSRLFVLRTDAPSSLAVSLSRLQEFEVLRVARRAGVKVPEPILACDDPAVIGKPFYVMRHVAGEARGRRLVRDPSVLAHGEAIVADLARELAKLHALPLPVAGLPFLAPPPTDIAHARIVEYRELLDTIRDPQPVFEWGLRQLDRHLPRRGGAVLIHSDFRTGNILVHECRVAAILDWEFARYGDPHEDLGWFLAKCWRFGAAEREAGGLGSRRAFLDAYAEASGRVVDDDALGWWEVMATIRWGVIALLQSERHLAGRERSLELALTAHVVPELELDVLRALGSRS